jgi:hypothetical protein
MIKGRYVNVAYSHIYTAQHTSLISPFRVQILFHKTVVRWVNFVNKFINSLPECVDNGRIKWDCLNCINTIYLHMDHGCKKCAQVWRRVEWSPYIYGPVNVDFQSVQNIAQSTFCAFFLKYKQSSETNLITGSCSWLHTFQKKAIAKNWLCDVLHCSNGNPPLGWVYICMSLIWFPTRMSDCRS